jgi:hypothetical protein
VESFASLRSEIALFSADFTNPFVGGHTSRSAIMEFIRIKIAHTFAVHIAEVW